MRHTDKKRTGKMGKLLLGGVAFLIAVAFLQAGFRHSAASGPQKGRDTTANRVTIEVNPGGSKAIDLGSRGYLPVAIFGAKEFDVAAIDPVSLNFAGASITKTDDSRRADEKGDKKNRNAVLKFNVESKDVNKDGIMDLVASFPIAFFKDLSAGTRTAVLKGRLIDGSLFEGSQTVEAAGVSPIKSGGGTNAPGGGTCNPTPIVFPADPPGSGNATPYPSNITVAGGPTSITGVTVILNDVSHTFPDDLEIILVSPTNQVLILDNGQFDGTDAIAQDITYSQTAANYAPSSGPMVTGTYKPVSYFVQNSFDPTAPPLTPAAPYAHTFFAFNGSNANGTWSLYARDVVGGDTGAIAGGWCIDFPTNSPACTNQLFTGSIAAGDTTQAGRITRDGISSLCDIASSDPCTVFDPAVKRFDSYTITNNSGASTCVTATLTSGCGTNTFLAVYLGSYNPASICTNYIASIGNSSNPESPTMSFGLQAGQTAVLVVHEVAATGCASYGLLVEGLICAVGGGGCTLTCPPNVTQGNDPGQCGAVVTYPPPTPAGTCGTITCTPPSGSFFPVGTTTVTCTEAGGGAVIAGGGASCSFSITVIDNQPPTITCPANQTQSNDPNQCGAVVNFPPPTASDNCPGVGTPVCSPPSGSFFPVGTTTVTCRVSDATTCANIFAVDTSDNLVNFRTTTPGIISSKPIMGLAVTEDVVGIDFRPATGQLFGLVRDTVSGSLRLITINPATGATAQVGAAFSASGTDFGFDFNPTVDRIRITSNAETNLSVNPDTGAVTVQTPLNPGNPNVVGSAYTNNFVGATTTVLYAIDSGDDMLKTQNPPANGTLATVGPLTVDTTGLVGFDISQCGGTAYASLTSAGNTSSLYTINLMTGTATLVGQIGGGNDIRAMSVEMARTSSCTFTVRVNDTQPPTITCPANVVAVTPTAGGSGTIVCFPPPTASDNCPGVTTMCVPPSGSTFPIGTTTVTCTATDASGNTTICTFTVSTFNARLQDDSVPSIVVLWNTMSGNYIFCCGGTTFTGQGKTFNSGMNFVLDHNGTDRRVRASLSAGSFPPSGNASLQFNAGSILCTIRDSDTRNDTAICGGAAPGTCPPASGSTKDR
jgi:subtilisin-like proprotein convertase family protein